MRRERSGDEAMYLRDEARRFYEAGDAFEEWQFAIRSHGLFDCRLRRFASASECEDHYVALGSAARALRNGNASAHELLANQAALLGVASQLLTGSSVEAVSFFAGRDKEAHRFAAAALFVSRALSRANA
jgi:hypothetical protein